MSLEELSNFTIISKYAKYLPDKQRRETWDEIVNRSLQMHLKKFHSLNEKDKQEIIWAFDLVRQKRVLPSMRSAQFAGEGIERKNERIYNCCFMHVFNTRCMEKGFYLLLCGVGCGFGLSKKWVEQFPLIVNGKHDTYVYEIEDSIEGWAKSLRALVDSFLDGNTYTGKKIIFDYSRIRPKGAPISHGGTAPGPEGLKLCHERIEALLNNRTGKLRPIDVYDILMHASDAVLSGGIRRAACLVLFDKDDNDMLFAKTGNWYETNPQRGRSNNTVLLKRDEVTFEDFSYIIESTKQWGEPGFAFVNDLDTGLNPCAEIGFIPFYQGQPAVQFCNLTTINGNKITSISDLRNCIRAATIIGTLQASYTDFKFLDEVDKKLTEEEALLGVSILGYLSNPNILLHKTLLGTGANYATSINEEWSKKLGINPAARVTCTKPDGNSSCVLESPFSGIHPAHSKRYFRRTQVSKIDPVYQHFRKYNEALCEHSTHSSTNSDDIIVFPIEVIGDNVIFKDDLTAIDHLNIIKDVNQVWVKNGEKNNKRNVSHSVSCTVLVSEDEWEDVARYLYENKDYFTAVALLARTGDKDFVQPAYEAVITEEDSDKWINLMQSIQPVDYSLMVEETDNTHHSEEISCAGGACMI